MISWLAKGGYMQGPLWKALENEWERQVGSPTRSEVPEWLGAEVTAASPFGGALGYSRAIPSFPSQLEWKIGLAWANTRGSLNSPP